jgi:hypothetical protein
VPRLIGTFPATGAMTVDPARREAYFYGGTSAPEIRVYDTRDFILVRTVAMPTNTSYYSATQMLRWGANGLVVNLSNGGIKFVTIAQ